VARDPLIVRVLIVEDDDSIAVPLAAGLEREGFAVERVARGGDALSHASSDLDVVLLDLNLPDGDGLDVCRALRSRSDVPIICLTARSDEAERVQGLESGADDYIVKPFGFRELVARVRAVVRRRSPAAASPIPVRVGDLEIDRRTRSATLEGRTVDLTAKEFDILATLADDPGAVVERQQLLERVWGAPWYGPTKTLDVHIASVRRKLGRPGYIEAVRGVGFRLIVPR
jgi:DNA-binding response OmpR family regulator